MNLSTMRTQVRRDLKDETPTTSVPTLVDDCDSAWTAEGGYTVVTQDSADKQQGTASMKAVIYAGHTTGLFAYHNISSMDLTGHHTLRFWIKSSVNQNAGDLQILLDNTLGCGSPVKTLDIPTILADQWYEVEVLLGDTSALSAIVSVGLSVVVDNGACTVWLDNVRAFQNTYKWNDDELDRHIDHALEALSYELPCEASGALATVAGSREIDIATLTDRVKVYAVEYPIDEYPQRFQRFSSWLDTITLVGEEVPDGSNCKVYYGTMHTLDAQGSTIPAYLEGLVARGAQGYAMQAYAAYSADRSQPDYRFAQEQAMANARQLLDDFRLQLRKMGHRGRLRTSTRYLPATNPVSKITDWGP